MDILASKHRWLPNTLYCQLQISRQTLNIALVVGNCEHSATGILPDSYSVIQLFNSELRALERELSELLSPADYICLCASRTILYILGIAAVDSAQEGSLDITNSQRRSQWIVQTYISIMSTIRAASNSRQPLSKMPTRIWKILGAAVSFLILLKCSKHCQLVDSTDLSRGIRQGWELLGLFEITPDDYIPRSNTFLQHLSNYSETLKAEEKTEELLSVRTRMGYNVVRSTALLLHKQAQENASASNNGTERAADDGFSMDDVNLFLDFDWDNALLDILS